MSQPDAFQPGGASLLTSLQGRVLISSTGSQASESHEITLYCSILGPTVGRGCPVDISPLKTVGHLRKAIKQEMERVFRKIPAEEIDIWKVSESPLQHDQHPTIYFGARVSLFGEYRW